MDNFTFSARVDFDYVNQFDQCGLIFWLDAENWCKVSIEYENAAYSRLGSVVTNNGYSDWATTDLITPTSFFYRVSRRGPDFLLESSPTGIDFRQMRVFHLHRLGETTLEMGRTPQLPPPAQPVEVGVYACSPGSRSLRPSSPTSSSVRSPGKCIRRRCEKGGSDD
jgi:regulation of enolase protein 1 (concanavalin A-like superfamily)